ncbi:CDP-diacylglycerol---serine O-phosphatidyltransferase [Candidatus Xenohaliotis californiensis]|uniref:CDP-diacylglycerol---serine O-phosphatidyltransferase n=1 Tax=Candidatus Xenohaliotis californiensis TaxID=84677 RepID=A0ABM9N6Z2_9RICK|nr:CDP-diacylglycerol---serine O-phosphatidyltransferase [Candidatus Xenohaliotis californiensis]
MNLTDNMLSSARDNTDYNFFPLWRTFPSIITLFALCLGLHSIKLTSHNKWEASVISIIGAAFLDGIDGRIARLLGCSSVFGAQLDSLADFLNFGVAPALLIYFIFLTKIKVFGWSMVTVFVICMAIRLARFNTNITYGNNKDGWRCNFFYGIPAPAAAVLIMLPVILSFKELEYSEIFIKQNYVLAHVAFVSVLTVSHLPTFSLKKIKIHKCFISPLLLCFGIAAISLIVKPWIAIPVFSVLYIVSIPFSMVYYYVQYKKEKNFN